VPAIPATGEGEAIPHLKKNKQKKIKKIMEQN
jgi:hypothetical protein